MTVPEWKLPPPDPSSDEATIQAWRAKHGYRSDRDEDRRRGFTGWANRLDKRVGVVKPRNTHVPMRAGEIWREMFRQPVLPVTALTVVLAVVLIATVPVFGGVLGLIALQPVMFWAVRRVRQRRLDEMRAELGVTRSHE